MKKSALLILTLALIFSSCSQKQFAFRKTIKVESAKPTTFKTEEIVSVPVPTLLARTTINLDEKPSIKLIAQKQSPIQSVAHKLKTEHHSSEITEVSNLVHINKKQAKRVDDTPNKGTSIEDNNFIFLNILGLLIGLAGFIVFGIILGLAAFFIGLALLKMAEQRGKSKVLPLIIMFLGILDVFGALVVISMMK